MTSRILALSLGLLAAPLSAQADPAAPPELSLQQRGALRCSAAIAIVTTLQAAGDAEALRDYPPLGERGREFFVRNAAKVMEETGFDRARIASALQAEAQALSDPASLEVVMPACLLMLDASGV